MKLKTVVFWLLTVFVTVSGNSQIIDLGRCHPNELSKDGLNALKEVIGEARIVVIGEQVHGVGTDYENFAILVKFLHEEMGFKVIAQEYCFFSFHYLNNRGNKQASAQGYREAMYWPQAKAKENDLLFDYLDKQKELGSEIFMEGFDPRIMLREPFYNFCDSLLNHSFVSWSKSNKQEFLKTLSNVLDLEYKDTISTAKDKESFINYLDSMLIKLTESSSEPRIIQNLKNLRGFAQNAWNLSLLEASDRFGIREQLMAENIRWIAETMYPNEKIILRMHNGHAAKNLANLKGAIPDSLVKEMPNVGTLLNERYGKSCFYIGTTYYSGTYCNWSYQPQKIPTPQGGSLERKLHRRGFQYAYVDLKENKDYVLFFNEFNSWVKGGVMKAPFGTMFDGLIFIDRVSAPIEKQKLD